MKALIVVIIIVLWLYNYIKFRRINNYYKVMVGYLSADLQKSPSRDKMLRLSSALIHIQQYRDAYDILVQVSNEFKSADEEQKIKVNIGFCKNPVPGLSRPKNLNHSYLHNFLLVRLGKRRFDFLTEQDYLIANSIQRNL